MPRPPATAPVPIRVAALIAVGAGLLGVLALPPFGLWPLAIASIASLSVAVHGRRARTGGWLGFLFGAAMFGPLLHWTGIYVGPVPWLLLSAAVAAYMGLVGALLPVVQRLPGWPVWVGCVWVLQEFLRDRMPFGGFPWGRWAFSQSSSPLRWFAALGGAPLVTFVTGVAGGALALALLGGRFRLARPVALGVVLLAAVPLLGLGVGAWLRPSSTGSRTTTVALIQGSTPDRGLEFNARRRQVLDNHVNETLKLAEEVRSGKVAKPSLVIWPENSSDIDPYSNPDAAQQIDRAASAVGVPILVGAVLNGPGPDHISNTGILWQPGTGPVESYTKRHPVPFAEYIPLRPLASLFSDKVGLVPRDMIAGSGDGLMSAGPFPFGDVICFEVAYDGLVESGVKAGAQAIVVQTNNATFGHSGETYQQLAMSQLRAVEHGRTVLQVSTVGVSSVIGPDGHIQQRSGALFTPDILVAAVPLRTATTPATRLGAIPEYVLTGLAALAVAAGVLSSARQRRTVPQARAEELIPA